MKNIYFIRHGETDFNTGKRGSGMFQSKDSPLNENGIEQSIKTGKYFKEYRKPIDIIICSPTLRAKQTAEYIAKEVGYKDTIIFEDNIKELQMNKKYTDLSKSEFSKLKDTDVDVASYFKYHEKIKSIKTPIEKNEFLIQNATTKLNSIYEDETSISSRCLDFISTLNSLNNKNILVISHGGPIRWITKIFLNNIGYDDIKGKLYKKKSNCAITYFSIKDAVTYLVSAQSNRHLKYIK